MKFIFAFVVLLLFCFSLEARRDKNVGNSVYAHDDSPFVVFFNLKDLKLGNKWTVYLPPSEKSRPNLILPREQAESIPFSSKHLPYILELFSFSPDSPQAKAVESTLTDCEGTHVPGETKFCATSFESMVEFAQSVLRSDIKPIASVHLTRSKATVQTYTIMEEPKRILTPATVGCHPFTYPYTIFYCHSDIGAQGFRVSLAGDNGDRIEAIALCHLDTSNWKSDHKAFRELGSLPGLTDVCHFFPANHMVWVSAQA
jgi:hypothetical protein